MYHSECIKFAYTGLYDYVCPECLVTATDEAIQDDSPLNAYYDALNTIAVS